MTHHHKREVLVRALAAGICSISHSAWSAETVPKPLLITVTEDEQSFLNNVPVDLNRLITGLAAARPATIYIRADRSVRFEAVGRALMAAEKGTFKTVVLGQPPNPGKQVPVILPDETMSLSIGIKSARELTSDDTHSAFRVDFDGTVTLNDIAVDAASRGEILRKVHQKNPNAQILLWPNKLAKYGAVFQVASEAQRQGLSKLIVTFEPD